MFRSNLIIKGFNVIKNSTKLNCARISTNSIRYAPAVTLARTIIEEPNIKYEAPPLIVMHGLLGSKQNWRSISKALHLKLNPKRKIITLDARNHGDSPHSPIHTYKELSDDVAKVLQDLRIEKATIMGHSMGGRAMMYFALQFPNLVEKAIIVDISPVNTSRDLREMEIIFSAIKSVNIPNNLSPAEGRREAEKQIMLKIRNNKSLVDFILLNLRKSEEKGFYWAINVDALQENFKYTANFPLNELGSAVYTGPVLFIGGTMSDFIKKDELPQIQTLFPTASISWLETGHLVHLEKPQELITLVSDFVNSKQ